MRAGWYLDRRDEIWTIDLDPDFNGLLEIDWSRWFTPPVTSAVVPPGGVVSESGEATVSVVSATSDLLVFRAQGSGVRATFRVAYGQAESDDITVRLRSRQA